MLPSYSHVFAQNRYEKAAVTYVTRGRVFETRYSSSADDSRMQKQIPRSDWLLLRNSPSRAMCDITML